MRPLFLFSLPALLPLLLTHCQNAASVGKPSSPGASPAAETSPASTPDVGFLLSMTYDEAASISPQKLVIPPFASVAADKIDILSKHADGTPKRVRATGHVFVQVDYREQARALCQEALISGSEVILRGKPVLQRGSSTVEGLADNTVFYMLGTRLRAIGTHKVSNANAIDTSLIAMNGPWSNSANPLLPPLEEANVPSSIRDELRKAAEAEALHQQALQTAPAPPVAAPR